MPVISRQNLEPSIKAEYDQKYKAQLRKALLNPGLTADQRTQIRLELALVGLPRVYSVDRPPRPGAIE